MKTWLGGLVRRAFFLRVHRAGPVIDFKGWPWIALVPEAGIGVSLYFSPGWAHGWPLGLMIHTVWPAGMAVVVSVLLLTLAAALGGFLAGCRILPRSARPIGSAWFVGWALVVALAGIATYRACYAEALTAWPNGYHP